MGHVKVIVHRTSMVAKQAAQLQKFLGLSSKKPRFYDQVALNKQQPKQLSSGVPVFLARTKGFTRVQVQRRQSVLNRHFTEIVSDVLSSDFNEGFSALRVNITSIESLAWNKGVRIFYSIGKPFDETIHQKLGQFTVKIRLAISERHLTGRVPPVNFVYDSATEFDAILENSLIGIQSETEVESNHLVQESIKSVQATSTSSYQKTQIVDHIFSAPDDMSNISLGFDYPNLYNQVAAKLKQGRGDSSRMLSETALADAVRPLIKIPEDRTTFEEDPTIRILKMKKFLVSQKKKSESQARIRRKQELLSRDSYKWEEPIYEDDTNGCDL